MKKLLAILFVIIFIISAIPALAADMPGGAKKATAQRPSVKAPTTTTRPVARGVQQKKAAYPAGPIQKLERGFNNAAFGWTEIPKRVVDKTKESNPIKGAFLGIWQGTCKAFARTASGFSEMLTFPIGRYDQPRVLPDMPAAK